MDLTPVNGKSKFLLFRKLSEASTKVAAKLSLQLEHAFNKERDSESIATKDGAVVSSGGLTVTLSFTAVMNRKDECLKLLTEAFDNDDMIEIWEVDIEDKQLDGKFGALYAQGKLTSFEAPAPVDGFVEVSGEIAIVGKPVAGMATLTEENKLKIEKAYSFVDTTTVSSS